MIRKAFVIAPLVALCALTPGKVAATVQSGATAPEHAARPQASIRLAEATMQQKQPGVRPTLQKAPAKVIKPNCPRGTQWDSVQRMCVPGPAATPIPIPGRR